MSETEDDNLYFQTNQHIFTKIDFVCRLKHSLLVPLNSKNLLG